jgi:predicted nuclease of predicted toxin-antitoxin system
MKLLADENFPAPVIAGLRQLGHDVFAVAESIPGASDSVVLAAAVDSQRLLLTLDRDYGDLIFHHQHPTPPGVVLFRLAGRAPADDNQRMLASLQSPEQWLGQFTTITDTLIRWRSFPSRNSDAER